MRLITYLTDSDIRPATQTCRMKVWAHDNAFTILWLNVVEIVLLLVLVFR